MTQAADGHSAGTPPAVVVNGYAVVPVAGWPILDAARAAGVSVPTLCHHPALPSDGSCRLCVGTAKREVHDPGNP
jgi:NADH dehydrogenase/NADH:ubiquinone oxidoreductase subunit G